MEMSYKQCIMFFLVYGLSVFQKKVILISLTLNLSSSKTLIMLFKESQEIKLSESLLIFLEYIYHFYFLEFM